MLISAQLIHRTTCPMPVASVSGQQTYDLTEHVRLSCVFQLNNRNKFRSTVESDKFPFNSLSNQVGLYLIPLRQMRQISSLFVVHIKAVMCTCQTVLASFVSHLSNLVLSKNVWSSQYGDLRSCVYLIFSQNLSPSTRICHVPAITITNYEYTNGRQNNFSSSSLGLNIICFYPYTNMYN